MTVTLDASPKCLFEAERFLKTDSNILRQMSYKGKTPLDLANGHTYKNPYLNV
jgi:ribosomal protein S6